MGLPAAAPIFARAMALGLRPPRRRSVSEWAAEQRYVSAESGSPYPGRWSNDLVPYLVAPMDACSMHHPAREVTFKANAQSAKTEVGLNAIGAAIDDSPAPILLVAPTIEEQKKYVKLKLQPMIDATPSLTKKVLEQKSRDEDGSTSRFKRFRGGYLQLTGANASSGLQMISVRMLIREEISEWPLDVDGRGDPMDLSLERTNFWKGREKVINLSTPGLKGTCRVSERYEASDQSRYHVPCPQCGGFQTLEWDHLHFMAKTVDDLATDQVFYVCTANGCVIEHRQKPAMLTKGRWVARFPERSATHRGFAVNALYSPVMTWVDVVRSWIEAKGNPLKEKVFTQQKLGEAYEEKGDAPEAVKLLARRESFRLGELPPGVLVLTMAVDVQVNRLEFAVYGWGIGKTSWLVDKGVVEGDPSVPATWRPLDAQVERRYPDTLGNLWPIDRVAVDSGYLTQAVYAWARGKPRVIATKGMGSHLHPVLGTPSYQEVNFQGKKWKRGIRLWPVGTWSLKAEFYANLRKVIEGPDADGAFPPGYVHFPEEIDEKYFEQITSESLSRTEHRGRVRQAWVKRPGIPNEALDLRVYAGAAAAHLGIDAWNRARWAQLAAQRAAPPERVQEDLEQVWGDVQQRSGAASALGALVPAASGRPAAPSRPESALAPSVADKQPQPPSPSPPPRPRPSTRSFGDLLP
jgi:phage terminase large subunit GpA-like protein